LRSHVGRSSTFWEFLKADSPLNSPMPTLGEDEIR
jgi:hypothetical protein